MVGLPATTDRHHISTDGGISSSTLSQHNIVGDGHRRTSVANSGVLQEPMNKTHLAVQT